MQRRAHHLALLAAAGALGAALLVSPASAQPQPQGALAISWDQCFGDGWTYNRTFACNTNSGTETLVISVIPDVAIPQWNGFEARLHMVSLDATTPSWWRAQTGGCRASALTMSMALPAGASACHDPYGGATGFGATLMVYPFNGFPNEALFRLVFGLDAAVPVAAGQEAFLFMILIPHTKTTGAGSCANCLASIGIGLESIKMTQPAGVGDKLMYLPISGADSDLAMWQTGGAIHRDFRWDRMGGWYKTYQMLSATDASRPTWGAVKSLYR